MSNRRVVFWYLFAVYLLAGASETFISPLFPLIRQDIGLDVADQAALIAVLTLTIGLFNLVGGWIGVTYTDAVAVRVSAVLLAAGALTTGMASSLLMLYVGQILAGAGVGLFFGPGLAIIGRINAQARGRAVASYGLAYSSGLGIAAFASNVGVNGWRIVFFVTAALAVGLAIAPPSLPSAVERAPIALRAEFKRYFANPRYRIAVFTGVVAGNTHYVVIGLTPEHFVSRNVMIGLIGGLVGAGRVCSMGGKYLSGWGFDRFGGVRTAEALMIAIVVLGIAEVTLPGRLGLVPVVPFVCLTAMLFPVSNAMVVDSLPDRASWGVGVYRSTLMLASAACALLVSVGLRYFSTTSMMLAGLGIPTAGIFVTARLSARSGADFGGSAPQLTAHPSEGTRT
jgi:predicted MFS family arabinose efflux permease